MPVLADEFSSPPRNSHSVTASRIWSCRTWRTRYRRLPSCDRCATTRPHGRSYTAQQSCCHAPAADSSPFTHLSRPLVRDDGAAQCDYCAARRRRAASCRRPLIRISDIRSLSPSCGRPSALSARRAWRLCRPLARSQTLRSYDLVSLTPSATSVLRHGQPRFRPRHF